MASDLPVFLNRKSDRVKTRLLRAASMAEMLGHELERPAGGSGAEAASATARLQVAVRGRPHRGAWV